MPVTAGDVIDRILDRLDGNTANPAFWARAELLQHINDGFVEFTLMAGQMTNSVTYNMIGSKLQAAPAGAIALIRVDYGNKMIEKSTVEYFDRHDPTWDSKSGILKKWAPCGLDRWFCDRQPTTFESVTLTYLEQPVPLTESTVIDLNPEYLDALTSYGFHAARFKEAGAELQQAMDQYDDFRAKAGFGEERKISEQWLIWSRDPNADTGPDYSTIDRS